MFHADVFYSLGLNGFVVAQDSGSTIDCSPGFFNENCTGVCHCLNGVDACDAVFGCRDYICDRGWNIAPACDVGKNTSLSYRIEVETMFYW